MRPPVTARPAVSEITPRLEQLGWGERDALQLASVALLTQKSAGLGATTSGPGWDAHVDNDRPATRRAA